MRRAVQSIEWWKLGVMIAGGFFCLTQPAMAETKFFGAVRGGVTLTSAEVVGVEADGDTGYNVGGSFGLQFGDYVRWDIFDLAYMSADQTDVSGAWDSSALSLGAGLRFGAFSPEMKFHPYASAGVAGNRVEIGQGSSVRWQWGFEWNVGVGAEYMLSESVMLGLRYRYRRTDINLLYYIPAYGFYTSVNYKVNLQTISLELLFF